MKLALTFAFGLGVGCALGPGASAQTPASLDIHVYAGLSITGAVGTVYSIEYVTDPPQTNSPSAWRCLEFLQLRTSPYLWVDRSAPATGKRFYRAAIFAAPTNLVFIPPGTFRMGSPTNEVDRDEYEGPQTAVTISRGFWMGQYEVAQGEYLAVMGTNPSRYNGVREVWDPDCVCYTNKDYGTDLLRPVETVRWVDATNYCALLTDLERGAGTIPAGAVYRLPTEAEWEYACRAWTSTRFSWGDDAGYSNLVEYAWCAENSRSQTHPVGLKLSNPWGLHDVHGNVWEWCQDWWSEHLPGGVAVDPQGPELGQHRVLRGGNYYEASPSREYRSAFRFSTDPGQSFSNVGFRVVLIPSEQ